VKKVVGTFQGENNQSYAIVDPTDYLVASVSPDRSVTWGGNGIDSQAYVPVLNTVV
jgi:hypothetical protein